MHRVIHGYFFKDSNVVVTDLKMLKNVLQEEHQKVIILISSNDLNKINKTSDENAV